MRPTDAEITRHHDDGRPDSDAWADEASSLPDPLTYVHVFGPDCPEVIRHLMFRAWLREHPDDLAAYGEAKRAAAVEMNGRPGGATGMDYNRHKRPVVRAIYDRMFRAHGMLP